MDKDWFPEVESNFLLSKKFSSIEYFSNILTNQYLTMAKRKIALEKGDAMVGEAWNKNEKTQ